LLNPVITKTKTTTYVISQIVVDFLEFDDSYRRIRGNFKYQGFGCFSCNRHFRDGEKISLVFTDKGNKAVCHDCGMKFKEELEGYK
jgi:hypothetical protein